jgi:hypothetical protein
MKPIAMWNIYPSKGQNGVIYDSRSVSPTILSGQGGEGRGIGSCNAPKILEIYEIKIQVSNNQSV